MIHRIRYGHWPKWMPLGIGVRFSYRCTICGRWN